MKMEKMDQWTDSNEVRVGTAEPGRNSFGSVHSSNILNINEKSQLNTLTQSRNKEELLTMPPGLGR